MRKIISVMVALAVCAMLTTSVFATEFVPSITSKHISLVTTTDDQNNVIVGNVVDRDGNVIGDVGEESLSITPMSMLNESDSIREEVKNQLLLVYNELKDGNMEIPYDELFEGLETSEMAICELFDVSWTDENYAEMVAEDGVQVVLTFETMIDNDADVYVTTYKNGEWHSVEKAVNNGDGTITCTFEHFCPVAISVPCESVESQVQTDDNADNTNVALWWALMIISTTAFVLIVVTIRKKRI